MNLNYKSWLIVLLSFFSIEKNSYSQENQVAIGTQFPLFYSLSYEEKIIQNLNIGVQFGLLQEPFENIIIQEAKRRDLDNELANIIQERFTVGFSFQGFLKYRFKHFHIGLSHSVISLTATDLPYEKLASIYNIDIAAFGNTSLISLFLNNIEMRSIIQTPGLFIGKEFKFKNPNFLIGTELGFQKIIASNNVLTYGEGSSFPIIGDLVNSELNDYFIEEGNLPTVNIYFIYRFKKSINGLFTKPSVKRDENP